MKRRIPRPATRHFYLVSAPRTGQRERGVLRSLRLRLDVRVMIKKRLHHLGVPSRGRENQGGEALLVAMF